MLTDTSRPRRVILAIGLLMLAARPASSQSLAYVGGLQYATGDFIFTQRTWSAYFSNGLSWSAGPLRASASVPLVMQDAGWLQSSGAGMLVPTGGVSGSDTRIGSGMGSGMQNGRMTPSAGMPFSRIGIGDPTGRVELALVSGEGGLPSVSVVGAMKAPLADVNGGFGTGKWDVGAGLSSALSLGGTSVFADAVYWKLGNPPGAALRNAVAYGLSIGRVLPAGGWSALATVSGASSFWDGLAAPVQAGAGLSYLLESGTSISLFTAAGLTRTAPTISMGLAWRAPLHQGHDASSVR